MSQKGQVCVCALHGFFLQGGKEKSESFLVWLLGLSSHQNLFFVRKGFSPSNLVALDSVVLRKPLGLSPFFLASTCLVHVVETCIQPSHTVAIWRLGGRLPQERQQLADLCSHFREIMAISQWLWHMWNPRIQGPRISKQVSRTTVTPGYHLAGVYYDHMEQAPTVLKAECFGDLAPSHGAKSSGGNVVTAMWEYPEIIRKVSLQEKICPRELKHTSGIIRCDDSLAASFPLGGGQRAPWEEEAAPSPGWASRVNMNGRERKLNGMVSRNEKVGPEFWVQVETRILVMTVPWG